MKEKIEIMVKKPPNEKDVCCGEKMNVHETVLALIWAKCGNVGEQILGVNFSKGPSPLNTVILREEKT